MIAATQTKCARPVTGRMVLVCLIAFFGVVARRNALMIRAAVSTFGGVETASSYQAGLAFEREVAAARAQDERDWQVKAKVQPDRRQRRWSRSTRAMPTAGRSPACEATRAARASDRPARRPDGRAERGRRRDASAARPARSPANGTLSSNCRATASGCSARATASSCTEVPPWPRRSISRCSCSAATARRIMDLAVEGVALRRLHRQDRGRPEAAARRRRGAAQLHQPAARGRLARGRARRRRRDRGARGHRLSRPSVPARARRRPRKRSTCAGC